MSPVLTERREPRFRTRTRVRLQVFDNTSGELTLGRIVESETRDFNRRGLFLAGVTLPCATRVHIYLDIPGGCVETFGVVVHNRPQIDVMTGMQRDGIGIRFTRISPADEQRLDAFLADRKGADEAAIHAAVVRVRAEQMSRRFGSAA